MLAGGHVPTNRHFCLTLTIVCCACSGGPVCLNMSAGTQRGEQSLRDCGTNNYPLRGSKMTMWQGVRACPYQSQRL